MSKIEDHPIIPDPSSLKDSSSLNHAIGVLKASKDNQQEVNSNLELLIEISNLQKLSNQSLILRPVDVVIHRLVS